MKKFLLIFTFIVSLFAIDKESAIEAIKVNPALLNTPQAQQVLKEKGLTTEEVLFKINQKTKHYPKFNTSK